MSRGFSIYLALSIFVAANAAQKRYESFRAQQAQHPSDGPEDRPHLSANILQWKGDSRGHSEGDTLVVETVKMKFNDQSRFGVGYLNGLSDENLRVTERFTRTDPDTIMMVCGRPPATFHGSPPHGGGEWRNLPLVRGRRERSERGGRSHIIWNCS